jgi:hypothetical protein
MNDREPDDERECVLCGCLLSGCLCTRREPSKEELEDARERRLSNAERGRVSK